MRHIHKHMASLLTLSLILALQGCASVSQGHSHRGRSKYNPLRDLERTTVSVAVERQHYYPGEDVIAYIHIRCGQPCENPYLYGFDISHDILLKRNDGVRMGPYIILGPIGDGPVRTSPIRSVWNYCADMSSWGDSATQDSLGFRQMLPGTYVGQFSKRIESPDFHFTVDPVPDSLQSSYNAYIVLRRLVQPNMDRVYSDTIADSIRNCLTLFLSEPLSCPWRTKALCLSLTLVDHWPQLLSKDTLLWSKSVLSLLHDFKPDWYHESDMFHAIRVGQRVFYSDESRVGGAESMLKLAKKHGNSAAVKSAKQWLNEMKLKAKEDARQNSEKNSRH